MSLQEFIEKENSKPPSSPAHVLNITSRRELDHQLDYYGVPLLRFDEPAGRKLFMESIRPALRYYCGKFGVEIPEWLEEETHFGHGEGSPEEMETTFGVPKLDPSTWEEWIPNEIVETRDVEEDEDEAVTTA